MVVLAAAALLTAAAWAKEGGDQYPNGAENWYAGAVPPAGRYYVNYFGVYSGQLKDGRGAYALLNGATPSANAAFNALRFVDVLPVKIFGADYGVHAIVPLVYQSVNLNGSADRTNLGDITVNPMILAWHHPQWHAVASIDVFLPTGYYDRNDARVSIGSNDYGFDPLFGVSWLPKSGWEVSAKVMYDVKTTNPATQYHSGQEFHSDYAAGKHAGSWMVGGTGYYLQQTTDDTVAGAVAAAAPGLWDAGRRGRVVAMGPSLGYSTGRHVIWMADWQHETEVRNRFGGDKMWFKLIVPVDGLLARVGLP
jgi:hypothetical protein